jgi:hypothetical protein
MTLEVPSHLGFAEMVWWLGHSSRQNPSTEDWRGGSRNTPHPVHQFFLLLWTAEWGPSCMDRTNSLEAHDWAWHLGAWLPHVSGRRGKSRFRRMPHAMCPGWIRVARWGRAAPWQAATNSQKTNPARLRTTLASNVGDGFHNVFDVDWRVNVSWASLVRRENCFLPSHMDKHETGAAPSWRHPATPHPDICGQVQRFCFRCRPRRGCRAHCVHLAQDTLVFLSASGDDGRR